MTIDGYANVLAAICVWREAQNQPYQGMLGVACVLRNRVTPTMGLVRVITSPWQFTSMTGHGDPNLVKWPAANDVAFERCCTAVDSIFGEPPAADVTGGATFYYSPPLTEPPQGWGPVEVTTVIGELTFCRAVVA